MGKGDNYRPTNMTVFRDNFDKIFKNKKMRKTWKESAPKKSLDQ